VGVGVGSTSGLDSGALDGFFSSFPLDEEDEEEDLAGGGGEAEVASAAMWFHTRAKLVESAVVSWATPHVRVRVLCHGAGRWDAHVLTEDKPQ
jgi:hypothetical protein